jgi:hypothetical protein
LLRRRAPCAETTTPSCLQAKKPAHLPVIGKAPLKQVINFPE